MELILVHLYLLFHHLNFVHQRRVVYVQLLHLEVELCYLCGLCCGFLGQNVVVLLSGELLFRCCLLYRVHLFDLRLVLFYLLLLVRTRLLNLHDLLDLLLVLVRHELHFHVVLFQLVFVVRVQIVDVGDLVVLLFYRQCLLRVHRLELGELVDRLLLVAYLLVQLRLELLVLRLGLLQFLAFRNSDLLVIDQLLEPLIHQLQLVFELLVLRLFQVKLFLQLAREVSVCLLDRVCLLLQELYVLLLVFQLLLEVADLVDV